jgi:hypothetical protein
MTHPHPLPITQKNSVTRRGVLKKHLINKTQIKTAKKPCFVQFVQTFD